MTDATTIAQIARNVLTHNFRAQQRYLKTLVPPSLRPKLHSKASIIEWCHKQIDHYLDSCVSDYGGIVAYYSAIRFTESLEPYAFTRNAQYILQFDLYRFIESIPRVTGLSVDEILEETGQTEDDIASDFWFTRNREGAGFWDGGYDCEEHPNLGDQLTTLAQSFGEQIVYLNNNLVIEVD